MRSKGLAITLVILYLLVVTWAALHLEKILDIPKETLLIAFGIGLTIGTIVIVTIAWPKTRRKNEPAQLPPPQEEVDIHQLIKKLLKEMLSESSSQGQGSIDAQKAQNVLVASLSALVIDKIYSSGEGEKKEEKGVICSGGNSAYSRHKPVKMFYEGKAVLPGDIYVCLVCGRRKRIESDNVTRESQWLTWSRNEGKKPIDWEKLKVKCDGETWFRGEKMESDKEPHEELVDMQYVGRRPLRRYHIYKCPTCDRTKKIYQTRLFKMLKVISLD